MLACDFGETLGVFLERVVGPHPAPAPQATGKGFPETLWEQWRLEPVLTPQYRITAFMPILAPLNRRHESPDRTTFV